jgi:hypothetical protein
MMKRTSLATAILAAFCAAGAAHAEEAASGGLFAPENFSASMALTNDYRVRGISNTDGPAISGSVDWSYQGFFVGAWASNTEFSDANIEIDYYGGYGWSWAGVDFTVQGIYYTYPGEDPRLTEGLDPPGFDPTIGGPSPFPEPAAFLNGGPPGAVQPFSGQLPDIDADFFEMNLGIAKTFDIAMSPSVGFNYHYSPDFFGEDGEGHHFGVSFGMTLPFGLAPYINYGHQTVEGDEFSAYFGTPDGYDWDYFQIGASYDIVGFTLDLSWVWVTEGGSCGGAGQQLCAWNGGFDTFYNDYSYAAEGNTSYKDLTDDAVVFKISRSF